MKKETERIDNLAKLVPGNEYHIFNKAIGTDKLFISEKDYFFFLQKLDRFILPVADILSYCLIPNHFHLLVKIKDFDILPPKIQQEKNHPTELLLSKVFSNFFNSYTKSYNIAHDRQGRLFLYPFKRIIVEDDGYMIYLINYIHRNPIHHGITGSFSSWKYSSYNAILSEKPTNINRDFVLSVFNDIEEFVAFHQENKIKPGMDKYLFE